MQFIMYVNLIYITYLLITRENYILFAFNTYMHIKFGIQYLLMYNHSAGKCKTYNQNFNRKLENH